MANGLQASTFLLLSILALSGVRVLSLPNKLDSISVFENEKAANMLDSANAGDITAACPTKDTYCLPRVKCPVKNTDYDRESLRFILGDSELFKDKFGCGAFSPTWTYVCCSTLDKVDAAKWTTSPEQWFLPSLDGEVAKSVNPSASFPVLLPWPGYISKNGSSSNATTVSSSKKEENKTVTIKDLPSNEKLQQPTVRSVSTNEPVPWSPMGFQQQMPFPFIMNDPRFNPWLMMMNPALMMPNQGNRVGMAPDQWMMQQQQQQPAWFQPMVPIQPQFQPSDWAEMIIIFPDGTTQRTLRDPRPQLVSGVSGPSGIMDQQRLPNPQPSKPMVTDAPIEDPPRIRRAATDGPKPFKLPTATGGMWKGKNETGNTTDAEGRALLPRPSMQWGAPPGGRPIPLIPIPPTFNVNSDRCGLSSSSGINARVLSGRKPGSQIESETSFGEFPWHAAIVNGETGDYLCAGTIISARFVLTVAHCVRKFQMTLLFVRVGDWDLSSTREMLPSYDVEVNGIQIHEDFFAGNLQNDIALLQLKFPLDFTLMPHVGSICLPPSAEPIYADCKVTGWGQQTATAEGKADVSSFSRTLKQTSQSLVTAQFCEKSLRPFLGQFFQLPRKGFVCAFDKDGKDSCFGDGGGALACLVNAPNYPKPMQYHVVGLVSWGVGCGMPGVPSAYTAIWDYLDWIHEKISPMDPYPMSSTNPVSKSDAPPLPIMARSNPAEESNGATSTTTTMPTSTARPSTTVRPSQPPPPKLLQDVIDLAFGK